MPLGLCRGWTAASSSAAQEHDAANADSLQQHVPPSWADGDLADEGGNCQVVHAGSRLCAIEMSSLSS